MHKRPLSLARLRTVPHQFSWVDQRLVQERYIDQLRLSGILRGVKLLYYQLLMSTYRHSNILRSESSGAPDF
jgi:hypothetical protein